MSAVRLILIRHGESEGNRDRTFTQSAEVPLTEVGHAQARTVAQQLAQRHEPQSVIASPFTRARQTAELIAAEFSLPVELEPDLREQSFGVFAGQPYTAMLSDAAYHEGPRWAWRPEGGESLLDVSQRAVPAFERIARDARGDTIVVSHGGVMLTLCAHVLGTWEGLEVSPNCGVVVVERNAGRYRITDRF